MGPKTLLQLLRPLYYSTLIPYRSLIVSLIDPFKGNPILIIKAPIVRELVVPRRSRAFGAVQNPES